MTFDYLDTSDKDLLLDRHFRELWGFCVNGCHLSGVNWSTLIDWISDDVYDPAQSFFSNWNTDRCTSVKNLCKPTNTIEFNSRGKINLATFCPLMRPSVPSMAIVLTVFSPRCWATSNTKRGSRPETSRAFKISGRPSSN